MSYWCVLILGAGLLAAAGCSGVTGGAGGDAGVVRREGAAGEPAPAAASTRSAESPYRGAAVRYQVSDVGRAVAFYTTHLGFELAQRSGKAFGRVANGSITVYLSGPGSSGARPMPDGTPQRPGGWNRIVLEVADLPARVEALRRAGVRFRNAIETGPGGRQIQVEDPDGNPIELFEPGA